MQNIAKWRNSLVTKSLPIKLTIFVSFLFSMGKKNNMSCNVKDEPAVYPADTRYAFQIVIHCAVGVHRQQPAVRCSVSIFLDDSQGQFQQWYVKLNSGLFPYGLYPPRPVVGQVKVVSCQQPHVSVWDAGIAGEQEHVPHMV